MRLCVPRAGADLEVLMIVRKFLKWQRDARLALEVTTKIGASLAAEVIKQSIRISGMATIRLYVE